MRPVWTVGGALPKAGTYLQRCQYHSRHNSLSQHTNTSRQQESAHAKAYAPRLLRKRELEKPAEAAMGTVCGPFNAKISGTRYPRHYFE
jgi:hypothetical protein